MAIVPWVLSLTMIHVLVIDTGVMGHDPAISKYMGRWQKESTKGIGHGTNVVSILLGGEVVAGKLKDPVCDRVKVDVCSAFFPDDPSASLTKCLARAPSGYYAVINISGGGDGYDPAEEIEIQRLSDTGAMFVVAAGNENRDISVKPFYPASYVYRGTIRMTAVGNGTFGGVKSELSNYGPGLAWYDGVNVTGLASTMSGTSMSAPKFTHDWLKGRCNE